MRLNNLSWTLAALALFLAACTPKIAEEVKPVTEAPKKEAPKEELSPCPKFSDAPNPDEAETNYVLYRDFLKVEDWSRAYEYWQKVYAVAPAADGRRASVYQDGITFLEHFMGQTTDSLEREAYIDGIFEIYDEIQRCYPSGTFMAARKGYDLYYTYPHRSTKKDTYELFKSVLDKDKEKTVDFVINPFTALLVELHEAGQIPDTEARKYNALLREAVVYGLKNCKSTDDCERWKVVDSYAPVRLAYFETVKGFYGCEYYLQKYYTEFEENPTNCDVIREVYSRLVWAECPEDNERLRTLINAGNANCVEASNLKLAYGALRKARYRDAIDLLEKAAADEPDRAKKGEIHLTIAKVYNAHLKNFSLARQYARQAASFKPNWGEPYILIGRLYASSGALCGPGRGWDSQIVVWPAIDQWNKAKAVDPSATAEANKWIGQYSQYMPNKEDIFTRLYKVGDTFKVGCWIQENTIIRASD